MNTVKALKYNLSTYKKSTIWYYAIIVLVLIATYVASLTMSNSTTTFGGMNFATAIFILSVSISAFKENYHMLLQNGVTRKEFTGALGVTALIYCAVLSAADEIVHDVGKLLVKGQENVNVFSIYDLIFSGKERTIGTAVRTIESFFYHMSSYILIFMLGALIALIAYRANKIVKILFFAGVPIMIIVIIPILDASLFDGAIENAIFEFIFWSSGYSLGIPFIGIGMMLAEACVLFGIIWLLMRRACKR